MRRSLYLTATSLGLLLLGAVPAAACPDHSVLEEAGGFLSAIVETVAAAAS